MWLKLKLTPTGDFLVVSVREFFVDLSLCTLRSDTWMGKYSNLPSQTAQVRSKSAIYAPKRDYGHSHNFYTGISPLEDYLISGVPVGYEGTKKWYRQNRHVTLSCAGDCGCEGVRAFQNLASQNTISSVPLIITVFRKILNSGLQVRKTQIYHS